MAICKYFSVMYAAVAAHSRCPSTLLHNIISCPLIYMLNLATSKILRLLVNSILLSCSTSRLWFVSSDNSAMCCRCLVNPSKQNVLLCLMWAQRGSLWAKNGRFTEVPLIPTTCDEQPVESLRWMQTSETLNKSYTYGDLTNETMRYDYMKES